MRCHAVIVLAIVSALPAACARRVPPPAGLAAGTPYISWIIMSGDGDNPDQEFVCQSTPRSDCVVPASRPDAQVFSDAHFYYHGAGAETKYVGTIDIGFFQGSREAHLVKTDMAVKKGESIANQGVVGIVTSTPGSYAIAFDFVATVTDTGKSLPIREQVSIVVK